jgi:hypothetical protein
VEVKMERTTSPPAFEGLRAETERLVRQGSDLPAFQTRTCTHCGDLTTFALQDRTHTLPPNHPVTVQLRNPRGQLVQTLTNSKPVGQFYSFELKTAADAPTGDWNALALVGGARFTKALKVETVMPNRLKIELDLGEKSVVESSPLKGTVNAQWLSGATAAGLRAANNYFSGGIATNTNCTQIIGGTVTFTGNSSIAIWALLILGLLMLFVGIPWLIRHPPPHQEHVFGASVGPAHR